MTQVTTLRFRIVEPMLFRAQGEFDPTIRGTYSRARSLSIPLPSTIAGALATILLSERSNVTLSSDLDWVKALEEILGSSTKIRGPYLMFNDELYVPFSIKHPLVKAEFLNLEDVKKVCTIIASDTKDYQKLNIKPKIRVKKEVRTGIMLETRDKGFKIAKEGYLYNVEFIIYGSETRESINVEILVDIANLMLDSLRQRNIPIRLGGEGRIAFLNFAEKSVLEIIKDKIWKDKERHSGKVALYLVSPAIFKEKVSDAINKWIKSKGLNLKKKIGETEIISAGFNIKENVRKPIYNSLKAGSILIVEGNIRFEEFYWNSDFGEGSSFGFGTIIAIPLA
jgi:CRISPR-associated protein Cmr3